MEVNVKITLDAHGNIVSLEHNCADKNVMIGLLQQAMFGLAQMKQERSGLVVAQGALPANGRLHN